MAKSSASVTAKAAFLWDIQRCTLAFMCIDQALTYLITPQRFNLDPRHNQKFEDKALKVISMFFSKLNQLSQTVSLKSLVVEYKIVHEVGDDLESYYSADHKSIFIKKNFEQKYALTKAKVMPLRLAAQLRTKLKNPQLGQFKKVLKLTHRVKPSRGKHFEYHLWVLALHVTKSNYRNIIKRIYVNDSKLAKSKVLKI